MTLLEIEVILCVSAKARFGGRMASRDGLIIGGEVTGIMRDVLARLDRGARTLFNILLVGETGMVAEHLARHVHELSGRAGQFVIVNCETLSDAAFSSTPDAERTAMLLNRLGEFESVILMAKDGTLFLDRVEALSLSFQGRVFDMLEAKESRSSAHKWGSCLDPVDVRIVAATQTNLQEQVAARTFYDRLYYRLDEFKVDMRRVRELLAEIIIPHFEEQVRKGGH